MSSPDTVETLLIIEKLITDRLMRVGNRQDRYHPAT
jgi:hypothetical protein